MEQDWKARTRLLIGEEALEKLAKSHVLVAGLGGVGAYVAEQLVRAGIGKLTIVDGDTLHLTNRNRQLPALESTMGMKKTDVMTQRLRDINPDVELIIIDYYVKDQLIIDLLSQSFDYVVDAIDSLTPKVFLLFHAHQLGHKVVSSMGAGGKLDPQQVKIVDIAQTYQCRLAYYIRKKLHKLGVWEGITAVYSSEVVARRSVKVESGELSKRSTVGTISYMPALFGMYCASVVIRSLIEVENH